MRQAGARTSRRKRATTRNWNTPCQLSPLIVRAEAPLGQYGGKRVIRSLDANNLNNLDNNLD
jgi:hypothetical protein